MLQLATTYTTSLTKTRTPNDKKDGKEKKNKSNYKGKCKSLEELKRAISVILLNWGKSSMYTKILLEH